VRHWLSVLTLVLLCGAAAWYAMMAVHESGHAIGAWVTGGRVTRVVLQPFAFSRTDVGPNPHPLFVVWSGPVWGAMLPLAAWLAVRAAKAKLEFLARFFAGFCMMANGVYLASAVFVPAGDTEELLRYRTPLWAIVAPGVAAFACGLVLWNGLGPSFGFQGKPIDRAVIAVVGLLLALLLAGMLACSLFR
jgi:hypothetical protein